MPILPLRTNNSEILMKIQNFPFMKINFKMSSANGGHFVLGRWFNAWIWILQNSPAQFKENVMNGNNPLKNAEGGSVDKAKQKMEFVREANHPAHVFAYVGDSGWRKIWEMQIIKDVNTLRPRQNGRLFPDISKWIFLNENTWTSLSISLKFVPRV